MNKESIKKWLVATSIRAVKTGAQAVITLIGSDMVNIVSLDWPQILGITATMMVLSVLTSIAGVPEVQEGTSPLSKRRQ